MSQAIYLLYRDGEHTQIFLSFIYFLIQRTHNINAVILEWRKFGDALQV